MSIKEKTIAAVRQFEKLMGGKLSDFPPAMFSQLRFQWHPETEAMAIVGSEYIQFTNPIKNQREFAGIPFERVFSLKPGTVRLALVAESD